MTVLNILLVNDDGYQADGIRVMFDALVAAGHNVTLVAPKGPQSGQGTRISIDALGQATEVVEFAPGQWFVDATPVTTTQAGLDFILGGVEPDLVISGINEGENVGASIAISSGTVSAATTATRAGIPAIAVSAGTLRDPQTFAIDEEALADAYEFSAEFVVDLVAELIDRQGDNPKLLPDGVGLNVNIPAVVDNIEGTALTVLDETGTFELFVGDLGDGPRLLFSPTSPGEITVADSEGQNFLANFVTVTPVDGDWTASDGVRQDLSDRFTSAPADAVATPLNILLTNDDGISSEGLEILYNTLTAAGHTVTVVAPQDQQSGTGTALDSALIGQPLEIVNRYWDDLIVFGDSLADVGNIFIGSGNTFPPAPPYDPGRFSNGAVFSELLAQELGLAGSASVSSLLGGDNYAFSGAQTGEGTTPLVSFELPNVGTQINTFLATDAPTPTDLFAIFAGSNDFLNNPTLDPNIVVTNVENHIRTLVAAGAEGFVIGNLTPLGQTPTGLVDVNFSAGLDALSTQYNALLRTRLDSLETELGVSIFELDLNTTFQTLQSDPSSFGFTNTTEPALDVDPSQFLPTLLLQGSPDLKEGVNPAEYFFWDSLHPTAAASATAFNLLEDDINTFVPEDFSSDQWFVDAGVRTTTWAGLDFVLAGEAPDLVISGINAGENIGPGGAVSSGTVSAAVTALLRDVPSIAVSGGIDFYDTPTATYEAGADFIVELIAKLQATQGSDAEILPDGIGLSVNIPSRFPQGVSDIQGVAFTNASDTSPIVIGFGDLDGQPGGDAGVIFGVTPAPTNPDPLSEGDQFLSGFITVTPIDGDWTADATGQEAIVSQLAPYFEPPALVSGTPGADILLAGTGNPEALNGLVDLIFTGAGNDEVDMTIAPAPAGENRIFTGSGHDVVSVADDDRAFGGSGTDEFYATDASGYRLSGGAGDDLFFLGVGGRALGGDGDDRFFVGEGGDNLLSGGAGADAFWLTSAELPTSANTIVDFTLGTDLLGLIGYTFADLSFSGSDILIGGETIATGGKPIATLLGINAETLTLENFA